MLSILIPIYQFDVRPLIIDLLLQAGELDIPYELLCFDDGSSEDIRALNRELVALPGVIYREMPQNMGRSRIRTNWAWRPNTNGCCFSIATPAS